MENLSNEIWVDIPKYEGYYRISSLGRIISLKSGKERILSQSINRHGYYYKVLRVKGEWKSFLSHQLVAIAFLNHEPCGGLRVINHKDGNKLNNSISNLEIVSHRENTSTCFHPNRHTFSSRHCGVTFNKRDNVWVAKIQIASKAFHLGNFKNEDDAGKAYQKAVANVDNPDYFESIKRKKSSMYKGVSYHKREQKWKSYCLVDGKYIGVGTFEDEKEAYIALQQFQRSRTKDL